MAVLQRYSNVKFTYRAIIIFFVLFVASSKTQIQGCCIQHTFYAALFVVGLVSVLVHEHFCRKTFIGLNIYMVVRSMLCRVNFQFCQQTYFCMFSSAIHFWHDFSLQTKSEYQTVFTLNIFVQQSKP